MAANGDSSIMPLISEKQTGPSPPSNTPSESFSLERKLQVLQRSRYLQRFKALQVGNLSGPEIKKSLQLLMLDHHSHSLRTDAIIVLANFLWPPNSWLLLPTRSASSGVIYLQCPERNGSNISRRALILVNETSKPLGTCSTVTLLGQHGRLDFNLRNLNELYSLFEAALDSDFTFAQKQHADDLAKQQQNVSSTIHQTIQQLVPLQKHSTLCNRGCSGHSRENIPLNKLNGQDKAWYPKEKRTKERRGSAMTPSLISHQPLRPSNLHCEMLQSPHSFSLHLVTYLLGGHLVSPTDHHKPPQSFNLVTCLGNSESGIDCTLLSQMLEVAADLLEKEGVAILATELRKFQAKCMNAYGFPPKEPSNQGVCGKNDKIIILCDPKVSNTVMVSKQNVRQGQTTWTVSIQHRTKRT